MLYWESFIEPGDVVIDVGANKGEFIEIALNKIGRHGHVYAVEPGPALYKILMERFDKNPRVTCFKYGASNEYKNESVFHYRHWTLLPTSKHEDMAANPNYHPAQDSSVKQIFTGVFMPLDSMAWHFPRIFELDFMKIDVDGGEYRVLLGARGILARFHPTLLLEIGPEGMELFGDKLEDLVNFLNTLDYSIFNAATGDPLLANEIRQNVYNNHNGHDITIDVLCRPRTF